MLTGQGAQIDTTTAGRLVFGIFEALAAQHGGAEHVAGVRRAGRLRGVQYLEDGRATSGPGRAGS